MGIFSRYKDAKAFHQLEASIKSEAFSLTMSQPGLEPFEYFMQIWSGRMRSHGKEYLAMSGEYFVHFWAVLPNPNTALELLARLIAVYTIEGFRDLGYFKQLEGAFRPFLRSMEADGGEDLNRRFRVANPRSYEKFFEKHGRGPFTPVDFEKYLSSFPDS